MIHVMIAENHALVRQSIRDLLEQADDITVIAETANGDEIVALAKESQPDLILLDISLPGQDGLQALDAIQQLPDPFPVLILSIYADPMLVNRALASGARGYLLKRVANDELVTAVYAVNRGEQFVSDLLSLPQ